MEKLRVGIVGVGVVGGALGDYLETGNPNVELKLYDPPRGFKESMNGCDAVFVCVPAENLPDNHPEFDSWNGQDLSIIQESLKRLETEIDAWTPVYLRTTVLPGTCDRLSIEYGLTIIHMPEFLTERKAMQDMNEQKKLLVGGRNTLAVNQALQLAKMFTGIKEIQWMTNDEAEMAKYVHNCFGAMKVNYFNIIHEACESIGANYERVINAARLTGFIEPTHTQVPGPDGQYGFGGKCFPKDLKAFNNFLESEDISAMSLQLTEQENQNAYRHKKVIT